MKDLEQYRKDAAENQKIHNAAKLEQITRAIDAENKLSEYCNQLIDWLKINRDKLIGKKLLNNDGMSKYFKGLFESFQKPVDPVFGGYFSGENFKVRAVINGGKYENKTYYCQYFDRTLYDVFKFDENGVCLEIRETAAEYPVYTVKEYLTANNGVKQAKDDIRKLEEKIRDFKKSMPYSLYEFRY